MTARSTLVSVGVLALLSPLGLGAVVPAGSSGPATGGGRPRD